MQTLRTVEGRGERAGAPLLLVALLLAALLPLLLAVPALAAEGSVYNKSTAAEACVLNVYKGETTGGAELVASVKINGVNAAGTTAWVGGKPSYAALHTERAAGKDGNYAVAIKEASASGGGITVKVPAQTCKTSRDVNQYEQVINVDVDITAPAHHWLWKDSSDTVGNSCGSARLNICGYQWKGSYTTWTGANVKHKAKGTITGTITVQVNVKNMGLMDQPTAVNAKGEPTKFARGHGIENVYIGANRVYCKVNLAGGSAGSPGTDDKYCNGTANDGKTAWPQGVSAIEGKKKLCPETSTAGWLSDWLPGNPTKSGSVFAGWLVSTNGGSSYGTSVIDPASYTYDDTTKAATADVTRGPGAVGTSTLVFKAKWLPVHHVYYWVNGELHSGLTQTVAEGASYTVQGAQGVGSWYASSSCTGTSVAAGAAKTMGGADVNWYAKTSSPEPDPAPVPDPSPNPEEGSLVVNYYVNGELEETVSVDYAEVSGLHTTFDSSLSGRQQGVVSRSATELVSYNGDARWATSSGVLSATYGQHREDRLSCNHYTYRCTYCGAISYYCYHEVQKTDSSGRPAYDAEGNPVYETRDFATERYYYHSYDSDYSPCTTKDYSRTYGVPANTYGGTWHGWYTDRACTAKASSTYDVAQGANVLNFYSYTTHEVCWYVNGRLAATETLRYADLSNPYRHGDDVNTFGGTLDAWYPDTGYVSKVGNPTVTEGLRFYGRTSHQVHFLLDEGANGLAGEEDCCLYEQTGWYGEDMPLPTGATVSGAVTREGCEPWSDPGPNTWYASSEYSTPITSIKVEEGATVYSYNVAYVIYDLADYAKSLDRAEGGAWQLYGVKVSPETVAGVPEDTMRAHLPFERRLFRYGDVHAVGGDATVYWLSPAGLSRAAQSIEGGFVDDPTSAAASVPELTVTKTVTVYKDYAQGIFDGIVGS